MRFARSSPSPQPPPDAPAVPGGAGRPPGRRLAAGLLAGAGLVVLNRHLVGSADPPADARAGDPAGPVRETLTGTAGRRLALTFDDGPHPAHTPAVLDTLRAHGVRATFFVTGENAEWQPDLLRAVAGDGHLVGNHTWSHARLGDLSRGRARDELARTGDLIEHAVGTAPRLARAPYGAWTATAVRDCRALGMEPLGWSLDTGDWTRPGTTRIVRALLDGVRPGAIVLAHDGGGDRTQTVAALAYCLPRLLDRGWDIVLPA
ncbi:polysaccharide deacetylase family protein [Streptomyces sp. RFCAC02]|uniref:polysaccharide deacetylase family protein n=1 Tax=Streptomyces sp. RFCAC02 TaxID=2499143 RepID=UPI0019D27CDD|nr:polysaccharide deacetylase family protein [Streptomyces sp. RFCAC02]